MLAEVPQRPIILCRLGQAVMVVPRRIRRPDLAAWDRITQENCVHSVGRQVVLRLVEG